MPGTPREADKGRAAALLTEAFGEGWDVWPDNPDGTVTFFQIKSNPNGRGVLTGLVVVSDGITANSLRKIPVGAIEQAAAESAVGAEEQMRAEVAQLPVLKRGSLSAAEFSRLVADHYKARAPYTSRPAAAMARDSGEKSATVHSWIREARLRGLLPEAGRGKRARG